MTVTDEMIEALERELAAAERIEALDRQLAAAERDRDKFRRLLEAQQIATMDALRERDALQARVERLENVLRFYAERMTYTSRTGMECGITKDHFGDRARAVLAADGENNDKSLSL